MRKNQMNYLQKKVEEVLKEEPKSREDDFVLISKVLELTNPETKHMTIGMVLEHAKVLKIPSFESITRARRKVFKLHPELIPESMKKIRKDEEKFFRKWSKEK